MSARSEEGISALREDDPDRNAFCRIVHRAHTIPDLGRSSGPPGSGGTRFVNFGGITSSGNSWRGQTSGI